MEVRVRISAADTTAHDTYLFDAFDLGRIAQRPYKIRNVSSLRDVLQLLGRGFAWLDTGTPQGMLQASSFIQTVQDMQGFYISCLEEIAWRRGFIDDAQLRKLGEELKMTEYGKYILSLLD